MLLKWVFKKTEFSNFYYDLTDRNKLHLIEMVSLVTSIDREIIQKYVVEIDQNQDLRKYIRKCWDSSNELSDSLVEFGRRIGWYACIRAIKPKVVVETGVHHGIGACVISSALMKNLEEGFQGEYIGTEINENSGKLFNSYFQNVGKIIYGDSITTLAALQKKIDIFINDSDHNQNYENEEYEVILSKLNPNGLIISDNAHVSDALIRFSYLNNRKYLFFKEDPKDHWYPGAGIGFSFL